MTDITVDGKTRVWWVPTVADLAEPTLAEVAAGEVISLFMAKDGLVGFQPDTAAVDTTGIEDTFQTAVGGMASFGNAALRLKKQSGTDDLYHGTLARGEQGVVVVRRHVAAKTAATAAQVVSVYPVECGATKDLDPEANSAAKYEVPLFFTAEPVLNAVLAAA